MTTKLFTHLVVKALEDDTDPEAPYGSFEAVLNAPTEDRDGEIIDPRAFEPLPSSIPILADHDGQVAKLVARAVPYYDAAGVLRAKGYFGSHPLAQYVRGLLTEELLDTMSVGFMNAARTVKDGAKHITSGELLEASFVVIPSNRDALVSAAKAFSAIGQDTEKAYGEIKALEGSFEERIAEVTNVLSGLNPMAYVQLIGTYPDRVVYQERDWEKGTSTNYEASYELGDNGLSVGDRVEVELTQVVSPKALELFQAKAGRRNSSKDQTAIQTAHDALANAGAECKAENVPETDSNDEDDEASKALLDEMLLKAEANMVEFDLNAIEDRAGWVDK